MFQTGRSDITGALAADCWNHQWQVTRSCWTAGLPWNTREAGSYQHSLESGSLHWQSRKRECQGPGEEHSHFTIWPHVTDYTTIPMWSWARWMCILPRQNRALIKMDGQCYQNVLWMSIRNRACGVLRGTGSKSVTFREWPWLAWMRGLVLGSPQLQGKVLLPIGVHHVPYIFSWESEELEQLQEDSEEHEAIGPHEKPQL